MKEEEFSVEISTSQALQGNGLNTTVRYNQELRTVGEIIVQCGKDYLTTNEDH